MWPPLWRRSFYVGATFVAPQFQLEYIRVVTASRSLWTLCSLYHCTIRSNIYTEVYRDLAMKACAASCNLSYSNALKLGVSQLIGHMLTAARFKPLIRSILEFSFSSTTYFWINYLSSLYSPGTDCTVKFSSIISCSLVAGETTCSQSCPLAMALELSPVNIRVPVTWQLVYMWQY
jgi:hypothetical protein